MKRIVSTLLACVLLLGCVFTLASCDKVLMGTYEYKLSDDNKTTLEFTPFKVTRTVKAGALGITTTETTEGKYKIAENEDGELVITFTWEGEEKAETLKFESGEDDNGVKYIKLGGLVTFKKVKK